MKIVSNLFGELIFVEPTCNCLYFQSNLLEYKFRKQLEFWGAGKDIEDGRLFLEIERLNIHSKTMNLLVLHGGQQFNLEPKINSQWLKDLLYNVDQYYEQFALLKNEFEKFLYSFTPSIGEYSFEFELSNFTPDQLFKMTNQFIERQDEKIVLPLDYKKILLHQWFRLNSNTKKSIIFYFNPEIEMNYEQLIELNQIVAEHNGHLIIVTKNAQLMRNYSIEQCHIIKENGMTYDLRELKLQLLEFEIVNKEGADPLSVELAIKDVEKDYSIMKHEYRQFLESDKY